MAKHKTVRMMECALCKTLYSMEDIRLIKMADSQYNDQFAWICLKHYVEFSKTKSLREQRDSQ